MSFGLICERKLLEATIMILSPLGSLVANFASIFFDLPKEKKFGVLMSVLLVQGFSLMSILVFSENLFMFMIIYFIWNFGYSYIFSQFVYYIGDHFPQKMAQDTPSYMNIVWSVGGIFFIGITFMDGNWIHHCVYMTAMPLLASTFLIYIFTDKKKQDADEIS